MISLKMIKQIIAIILQTIIYISVCGAPVYNKPIKVAQPDGSVITVQLHGDEFLMWTTYGNSLVEKGKDGFYYYASFTPEGGISRSNIKVSTSMPLNIFSGSVHPPLQAIERALKKRESVFKTMLPKKSLPTKASVLNNIGRERLGNSRYLVILVEFNDVKFSTNKDYFSNLLNSVGYSHNGATGSVRDYFYDNSNGKYTPSFDVIGPVKLTKPKGYYGENSEYFSDLRVEEMMLEAVEMSDNVFNVDFSKYDNDNDGNVDNVAFILAGYSENYGVGPEEIRSFAGYFYPTTYDGKIANRCLVTSELKYGSEKENIGVFCHEFCHILGLPDTYDTDYEFNGFGYGLYSYSIMCNGLYNNDSKTPPYLNSIERYLLGWSSFPSEITSPGNYTLTPVRNNKSYYFPTVNEGEYFVYEYRDKSGWDSYLDESGLLIYHVDQSENIVNKFSAVTLWIHNIINCYSDHQCFDIVKAVDNTIHSYEVPFPGKSNRTAFTSKTKPAAKDWANRDLGCDLTDITNHNSYVSFNVTLDNSIKVFGKIIDLYGKVVENATINIVNKENKSSTQLYSNKSGEFNITLPKAGIYTIEVIKDDYKNFVKDYLLNISKNIITINLFKTEREALSNILIKHSRNEKEFGTMGFPSDWEYVYFGVGFSSEELRPYIGNHFKTIRFYIQGTASEFGVFIKHDNECVLLKKVINPQFDYPICVDVSDAKISIPENTNIIFGYYLKGANYNTYAVTDLRDTPNSNYIGPDHTNIVYSHPQTGHYETAYYCYAINAEVQDVSGILYLMGNNIIKFQKKDYKKGDNLVLKLISNDKITSNQKPLSIKWIFNDISKNDGEVVVLTKGYHTIKAILTFSDHKETIIQEIKVSE